MSFEMRPVVNFPGYFVTENGDVWNDMLDRFLTRSTTRMGTQFVRLVRDRKQHSRVVGQLVVKAWLEEQLPEHFDSVIHLDGNRANCHISNLTLRPRWFAMQYHQELSSPPPVTLRHPIRIRETGEVFATPRDCAMAYGVLESNVFKSVLNGMSIFPGGFNADLVIK